MARLRCVCNNLGLNVGLATYDVVSYLHVPNLKQAHKFSEQEQPIKAIWAESLRLQTYTGHTFYISKRWKKKEHCDVGGYEFSSMQWSWNDQAKKVAEQSQDQESI